MSSFYSRTLPHIDRRAVLRGTRLNPTGAWKRPEAGCCREPFCGDNHAESGAPFSEQNGFASQNGGARLPMRMVANKGARTELFIASRIAGKQRYAMGLVFEPPFASPSRRGVLPILVSVCCLLALIRPADSWTLPARAPERLGRSSPRRLPAPPGS